MRVSLGLIALIAFLWIPCSHGQYTAEYLAGKISESAGMPEEQYREYSVSLSKTLGMLTDEQLYRVFNSTTPLGGAAINTGGGTPASSAATNPAPKSTANNDPTLNDELGLDDISFGAYSTALTQSSKDELDKVFFHLLDNSDATIKIEGHSSSGGYMDNQVLSEQRAEAAKNYLSSLGIDSSRIEVEGFGYSQPVDGEPASSSKNQRIEIVPQ